MFSKISNFKELILAIHSRIILQVIVVLTLGIIGYWLYQYQNSTAHTNNERKQVISAIHEFKNNLSYQLAIIATSDNFISFLNDGSVTRKEILPYFLSQMSYIHSNAITGWNLTNTQTHKKYHHGLKSNTKINLNLCYLDGWINDSYGKCEGDLTIYLSKTGIINQLRLINNSILSCEENNAHCFRYDINLSTRFGIFSVKNNNPIIIGLKISRPPDHSIYLFGLACLIILIIGVSNMLYVRKILDKYIAIPFKLLIENIKSDLPFKTSGSLEEISYLSSQAAEWKSQTVKIFQQKRLIELGKLSGQVVHDLRNYLFSLNEIMKSIENVPITKHEKISSLMSGIDIMLTNLLDKYNPGSSNTLISNVPQSITSAVIKAAMLAENICKMNKFKIHLNISEKYYSAFSVIDPLLFARIVINIIKNSIEAKPKSKEIKMAIIEVNEHIEISIIDDGKGISSDLLAKLGQQEVTFGKSDGHGIGLFQAFETVNSWNGRLIIKSQEGIGTCITIALPIVQPPITFVEAIELHAINSIILLDDDIIIHERWNKRFNFNRTYISVKSFEKPADFIQTLEFINWSTTILLIDYQFANDTSQTGIDIIKKYNLTQYSILVTGRSDEFSVITECEHNGIRLLSKNNIELVPCKLT